MNYVERHFGDWARDTAHLSMLEDGAYNRLVDLYYVREQALPKDLTACCRLVRAQSKQEREAVKSVLAEFFVLTDEGWRHKRCDSEISRFRNKSSKASASAKARWDAERTHSEGNANASSHDESGAMRSHSEGNATRGRGRARSHSPLPNNLSDEANASSSSAKPTRPTIPCPYEAIVEAYHELLPTLPRVRLRDGKAWTARQKAMRSVWGWVLSSRKSDGTRRAETAEQALEWLRGYFARASENDFLMGRSGRTGEHANWRCDLDFLLTDKGMKHVIERTGQEAAA